MKKSLKSLPHISLRKGGKLFGFGTSPEADWKIIFSAGLFLAVCMIIFNAYIFIKIDKGDIFTVDALEGGERTLDVRKLEEVVNYYEDRESKYEEIKSSGTSVPDPSI